MCVSLHIILIVCQPPCCLSAGNWSLPVGRRLIRGQDDEGFIEGVLFRGEHDLAVDALNKCKNWRQKDTREGKIKKIKTFHLSLGPKKGEDLYLPLPQVPKLAPSGNTAALLGLYWCHALPPLPSNEWN